MMLTWKINAFGESYSPEINKDTFEKVPSKVVFDRHLRHKLEENHTLYIIIGSDSGLLANYVMQEFKLSGSSFIFIDIQEVADAHQALFEEVHVTSKQKSKRSSQKERIKAPVIKLLVQGQDLADLLRNTLGYDEYFLRRQVRLVQSMSALEKNLDDYDEMFKEYERQLVSFQMSNNASSARRFMNAMLADACDMIYPVKIMKDYYKGMTFVLLGGAPSLPKIFPWLRMNRDKVIVLAASRIAGRLKQEDITPDYFIAVDPDPEMLDYSRELFEFADRSVLVTSNHLAPNVMGQWAGRNLYTRNRFSFKDIPEEEQGNLPGSGPTVMNSAVMLAGYMGAQQIILSGVDFCYDPSGQSHESSSLESQIGRYIRYGGHQVETYSGLFAETDAQMLAASRGLHDQVDWLMKTIADIRIVNINPYAAKIQGIELVSVDEISIAHDIDNDLKEKAWRMLSLSAKDYQKMIENKVIKVIDKFNKKLSKLNEMAKKGIQLSQQMHNTQDPRFSGWVKEIKKYRQHIETTLGEDLFMLFDYAYFDYVKLIEPLTDEQQTLEQTLATLKAYFSAVHKSINEFSQHLLTVRKTAHWRLKECQCQLTTELVDYWIDQQLPGRYQVWLNLCAPQHIDEQTQALLDRASAAFTALLAEKVPSFRSHYENRHQQLTSLWSHIKTAIQAEEVDKIKDIADYVKQLEGEEFEQLAYYLDAFLAKSREDWSALDLCVAKINHHRLIVPALQLKLDAALLRKDALTILYTLEDLSVYDAYYLYLFAKTAPLLGQHQLTIPAFIRYLQLRPHDRLALWDYWTWLEAQKEVDHIVDLKSFIESYNVDDAALLEQINQFLATSLPSQ